MFDLILSFPYQSILLLSQICVSPESSAHYKLQIIAQLIFLGRMPLFWFGSLHLLCGRGNTASNNLNPCSSLIPSLHYPSTMC